MVVVQVVFTDASGVFTGWAMARLAQQHVARKARNKGFEPPLTAKQKHVSSIQIVLSFIRLTACFLPVIDQPPARMRS